MPSATPQPQSIGLEVEFNYQLLAKVPDAEDEGLDINSDARTLRAELFGCDPFVELDPASGVLVVSGGASLRDRVELQELRNSWNPIINDCSQNACFIDEECDEQEGRCSARIHSDFALDRPSRPGISFHGPTTEPLISATRNWQLLYDSLEFDVACIQPTEPAPVAVPLAAPVLASLRGCGVRERPHTLDPVKRDRPPIAQESPLVDACGRTAAEIDGASPALDPLAPRSQALAPPVCNPLASADPVGAEGPDVEPQFGPQLGWNNEPDCTGLVRVDLTRRPQASAKHLAPPTMRGRVHLRHADPVATEDTLLVQPDPFIRCRTDADCQALVENFACDLKTQQCGLDLRGRPASGERPVEFDTHTVTQELGLQTYTYCRRQIGTPYESVEYPKGRKFTVIFEPENVTPGQPLPTVQVPIELDFVPTPPGNPNIPPQASAKTTELCVPPWYDPQVYIPIASSGGIDQAPQAPAVELWRDSVCCSSACPGHESELGGSCQPRLNLGVHAWAKLSATQRESWRAAECALPEENQPIGQFSRDVNCNADSTSCGMYLPADGDSDADCILFDLELRSPADSVYRSRYLEGEISSCDYHLHPPGTVLPLDLSKLLQPRVVLRARVRCSDKAPDQCDPSSAILMAEQLQLANAGTAPNRPVSESGPFFFHQRARSSKIDGQRIGEFALPVDPGLYAVTVLQAEGELGGPSDVRILDLRDNNQSPLVQFDGRAGTWRTSPTDSATQFEILPGIPVRVDLSDGFPGEIKVLPMDVGIQPATTGPGDCTALGLKSGCHVDLNAPSTCYPSDRGCRIRALVPPIEGDPDGQDDIIFEGAVTDFGQIASFTQREGGSHGCNPTPR